jgi:hypothetical protein
MHGRMHRFIIGAKKEDPSVDHINGNKLDNTRTNLRYVTDAQNNQNKSKRDNCTSKYIGVSYFKRTQKWQCSIMKTNIHFAVEKHAAWWYDQLAIKYYGPEAKDKKQYYIGLFTTEKDAAKARDKKAIELYGSQYAKLNFRNNVLLDEEGINASIIRVRDSDQESVESESCQIED